MLPRTVRPRDLRGSGAPGRTRQLIHTSRGPIQAHANANAIGAMLATVHYTSLDNQRHPRNPCNRSHSRRGVLIATTVTIKVSQMPRDLGSAASPLAAQGSCVRPRLSHLESSTVTATAFPLASLDLHNPLSSCPRAQHGYVECRYAAICCLLTSLPCRPTSDFRLL